MLIMVLGPACLAFPMDGHIGPCLEWDFLRCGGQSRTVSPVDVTTVIASQLTYCVEVAAELLADVEEQTVRSVHQAQRPGRESPACTGKGPQIANPRPTPKPGNLGPPWPPGTGGDPAGYSRGRPLGGSRLSLVRSGSPGADAGQAMNWRPIRGWTRLLHEREMKADSMPERLLIGPGSPPSLDPVYPELSPPLEPFRNF